VNPLLLECYEGDFSVLLKCLSPYSISPAVFFYYNKK
jgi:hypothetical protein